ncbi:MAG: Gfo/Idh/MocA family oxidoreductase [Gammaproteobacteria bacterium]|nr:Gfo/Idh/MocA family oxidoreductase [Gammaproteobacteria bacterium]
MTAPVKLAVVGAGAMAREHLRAFSDIPGVALVGIHSRTPDKAVALAQEFAIDQVCASIDQLYTRCRPDLVVVCVSVLSMKEVCCACFEHPWVILTEKPLGHDLAEAEAIASAAGDAAKRTFVAFNRRFYHATQTAHADLAHRDGTRFIHVLDQQNIASAQDAGHPESVAANFMFANSVHLIDYLRVFGRGCISRVDSIIPWRGRDTQVVLARIAFDSGDEGLYEGVWNGPGPWAVSVSTPSRRWEMRPLETAAYQEAGERQTVLVEPHLDDQILKPGLRRQAEAAVSAVRGNRAHGLTSLLDSLSTMRLIQAIFASESKGNERDSAP